MLVGGSLRAFLLFRLPLIRDLLQHGRTVHCIYWDNAGNDELPDMHGVTWCDLGGDHIAGYLGDLRPLGNFLRQLRLVRPDTVLCFNAKPIFYGGIAAHLLLPRKSEFAVLMEGRGVGLDFIGGKAWPQRLKALFFRISVWGFPRWIFLNAEDERIMRDNHMLRPSSKILRINGIGVDLKRFHPFATASDRWRHRSCTFLGRLIREKGPDLFAEIAQIVKSRIPDVEFHMAGQRSHLPSAIPEDEVASWLRQGFVDTIEEYDHVEQLYGRTSIAVLPTTYNEGLPTIAMEAQAAGVPILLGDLPQNRLALVNGETGYLISPSKPEVFAEKIISLLNDEAGYAEMARQCRNYAVRNFDQRLTNEKIIAFLLEANGGRA